MAVKSKITDSPGARLSVAHLILVGEGRMPDVNGKLSEIEKEKILKWVKEKAASWSPSLTVVGHQENLRCQVCGKQNWTLADHLVTPTVLNATGIGLLSPYFPQAMLVCNDCGGTVYINVHRLGLIQS
jgi:hypothetical protein